MRVNVNVNVNVNVIVNVIVIAGVIAMLAGARLASADVVIERVGIEAAPTDARDKAWDRDTAGAAPDPRIEISIGGKRIHKCAKVNDALVAACEVPEREPSAETLQLDLHVEDVDRLTDEVIGNARGVILPDASGRIELAVEGKLVKAWAEVRRVGGFWMSAKLAWPLGAVAGAGLALLAYAIFRRRFLTPGSARGGGELAPAAAEPPTRFWRSPVLLAGTACAITAIIVANYVHGEATQPLYAAIPLMLGAFSVTGTIVDAFVHEHLGATRSRVLTVGAVATAAVPIFHALGGIAAMFRVIGGALVLALVVWSLLDSI
jgi:hypothetical protein